MPYRRFSPFSIGSFMLIPEGTAPPQGALPIILGKKGAFGSGEHETTAACLELIPSIPGITGAQALDLGSGTGILAIAAARLGASSIVALDIDWRAALSCADNVQLNGLSGQIHSVCGELCCLAAQHFDIVFANIYVDILLDLAEELVQRTRPGGHILLSGIPLTEKFDIIRRYGNLGCRQQDSRIGEDYATYLLVRDACS